MSLDFSIVICSIDAAKFAQVTATYEAQFAGTAFEIIGIHDARSLAEGYNRGARAARGDIVVFSHDDIDIASADLPGALRRAAARFDVAGIVGTRRLVSAFWPAAGHPHLVGWWSMPSNHGPGYYVHVCGVEAPLAADLDAIDGMFFAVRREVLDRVRFDEKTFDGFHVYDIDFSYSAQRAGFRVGATAEIAVIHASQGTYADNWQTFRARFDAKHGASLPPAGDARPWSFARVLVPTKEDIVRQFPLARLVAITAQLRAKAQRPAGS